uniref:Uncharacterized protein n=1 Tax=Rhipicephalus zambeziensis TaxID=60191 RepID=A0A224YI18_9ACAR
MIEPKIVANTTYKERKECGQLYFANNVETAKLMLPSSDSPSPTFVHLTLVHPFHHASPSPMLSQCSPSPTESHSRHTAKPCDQRYANRGSLD